MACRYCEKRGKTWDGDDPKCAFPDEGVFNPDNWNCATLNLLREISRQTNMNERCDMSAGSIGVIHADNEYAGPDYDGLGGYIVLSWYKERGRTATAIFVHEGEPAVPITFEQAEMALRTNHEIVEAIR